MSELDFEAYRRAFYADPQPEPRFGYEGLGGVALYFDRYDEAVVFYTEVLGPPNYVEGEGTRGWLLGDGWLTLFAVKQGAPSNAETQIRMSSPAEADRLHAAFLAAGATGEAPTDELMYEPIRFCALTDPFGTEILIYARLE